MFQGPRAAVPCVEGLSERTPVEPMQNPNCFAISGNNPKYSSGNFGNVSKCGNMS